MKKKSYLSDTEVQAFCEWFAERINGSVGIDFHGSHPKALTLEFLHDGLFNYAWPDKTINSINRVSRFLLPLSSKAGFLQNRKILDELSDGLTSARDASSDHDFADWAMATMEWGGVGKNKGWIKRHTTGLVQRVLEANAFISTCDDDVARWLRSAKHQVNGLKFNAGWTKVYALVNHEFIIYDSRVAAALAWLVCVWLGKGEESRKTMPGGLLAFGCLKANEGQNQKHPKSRNPRPGIFPNIDQNPIEHLKWNIRANWVLEKSLRLAGQSAFDNLRELEASLFTLGYALNGARCVAEAGASAGEDIRGQVVGEETRMDKARRILLENPGAQRKEIIAKFIQEAGLTKAGASTYYQKLRKELASRE